MFQWGSGSEGLEPPILHAICWFTANREFQSVLLSPVLCEESGLTKTQGLLGGGSTPTAPHPPPPNSPPPLK